MLIPVLIKSVTCDHFHSVYFFLENYVLKCSTEFERKPCDGAFFKYRRV